MARVTHSLCLTRTLVHTTSHMHTHALSHVSEHTHRAGHHRSWGMRREGTYWGSASPHFPRSPGLLASWVSGLPWALFPIPWQSCLPQAPYQQLRPPQSALFQLPLTSHRCAQPSPGLFISLNLGQAWRVPYLPPSITKARGSVPSPQRPPHQSTCAPLGIPPCSQSQPGQCYFLCNQSSQRPPSMTVLPPLPPGLAIR